MQAILDISLSLFFFLKKNLLIKLKENLTDLSNQKWDDLFLVMKANALCWSPSEVAPKLKDDALHWSRSLSTHLVVAWSHQVSLKPLHLLMASLQWQVCCWWDLPHCPRLPPCKQGEHVPLKAPFNQEAPSMNRHTSSWWSTFLRNCSTPWRLKE